MPNNEKEYIQELFKIPSENFIKHLNIPDNKRIVFSGKFGKGKTTFLKFFFENQSQFIAKDRYNTFHLFPINYSVASNEDVFRYIKYDVLLEILKKEIQLDSNDFRFIDTLTPFIKKNSDKVIGTILRFIPKVGKDLNDLYDKINSLRKDFLEFHKSINSQNEGDEFNQYLADLENEEGAIFENDIITKLIESVLKRTKDENHENILIIDDLDRIDPEHIFRLLNVFSSHFDSPWLVGKENKFGFDKIIIVCDINNIRNIFRNKYGINVDFNGYINRFYSKGVFNYQNIEPLISFAKKHVGEIVVGTYFHGKQILSNVQNSVKSLPFYQLLGAFLQNDLLSLRDLINIPKREYTFNDGSFILDRSTSIDFETTTIPFEVILLENIFGEIEGLRQAISTLESINFPFKDFSNGFIDLVWLCTYKEHSHNNFENPIAYKYKDFHLILKPTPNSNDSTHFQIINLTNGLDLIFKPEPKDFYHMLLEFIKTLKYNNHL